MAFGSEDGSNDGNDGHGKPVEEGKTYEVEVEDIGSKGDGIARVDGFVVFVPETDIGDRVEVEIDSVGRKFAFGEVVNRLDGSADGDAMAEAADDAAAADDVASGPAGLEEDDTDDEPDAAADEDDESSGIDPVVVDEDEEPAPAPEPAEPEVCEMCGAPVDDPATHECDI